MKSSTRLDSALFQLTPTRTRCDLFIIANGKKEKIASGLLIPFVAHLKTAEDQIAKGGYSILLEPQPDDDAKWFTKGTVERFVRFVSTPEILERVHTIESEIAQIEKAIAIQGNNDNGLNTVEYHQAKPVLRIEGSNSTPDTNDEKAIVLYTPGSQPHEANGSVEQEGNSKAELMKVLDTRKNVLRKEQGMAFARAAAAGFDMDHMVPLLSFAKCFGASRLMDACLRFMDLWKGKHESGQWLEIEAAEAVSSKSEFSTANASGIMLSSSELASENNGKAGVDTSSDTRPPMNHQIPFGQQEYFPGQFPHAMFPPWPVHAPPGSIPFFQGYPMQGTPYYQNYSGNVPYHQSPHQPVEDSQLNIGQRGGHKSQSMDSRDSNTESETVEDDSGEETSHKESRKKTGRSRNKGMVVIRNINYITSKHKDSSGSESNSNAESDADKDDGDAECSRSSKRKDKEETSNGDGGHWQAFQTCLLRDSDEDNRTANVSMFATENNIKMKRPQNTQGDDPLAFTGRDPVDLQGRRLTEFQNVSRNVSHFTRASNDELVVSRGEGPCGKLATDDIQVVDIKGRKILHNTREDDFMIGGREIQSNLRSSSDLDVNGYEVATNNLAYMADESFIVPLRSMQLDRVGSDGRVAMDINSELPSIHQNSENTANKTGNRVNYEPDELSLLPERGLEKRAIGYDPALDYEMQLGLEDAPPVDTKNGEAVNNAKQGSKKREERRSKAISETLDKKKTGGPIRKGKPSKISPLDEARVRAEKLRTYKADLQKLKKEKEEAAQKRIEALKMERQKRIAARGSSTSGQSLGPTMATRKSLPTKLSPISHRGSKFSDSEPGSSSPLQRSKIRTASLGSTDSRKVSKITKSSDGVPLTGNMLTRSASSLSETKKSSSGVTPDSKASMAWTRRLSEPKTIRSHPASSVKMAHSTESVSKVKVSDASEGKKISAIMNLDRSKAATLPELKIKTSKGTSSFNQKKSAAKAMTMKINGIRPSATSGSAELNITDDRLSGQDLDDNPVIEKTVVMLEQKMTIPIAQASKGNVGVTKEHNDTNDIGDEMVVVAEYAAIHAPPSPMDGVDRESAPIMSQEKPSSYEVTTNYVEKESANFSTIGTSEKPYQAPFARVSSLEDPSTRNSEYGKAPVVSLGSASVETAKIHVSAFENLKLGQIPEVSEKSQVKESKGFRRFLKLGRKNNNSTAGEQSVESDYASVNGSEQDESATRAASSSEVHTLKNLISQDETPTASNTSQKSSRHFSLLSPFRSKTSEKKQTA